MHSTFFFLISASFHSYKENNFCFRGFLIQAEKYRISSVIRGIWLVGCFWFNGPLRQYFSLYRAVSQREGERGEKGQMREKMSKQPPPAPTASATGPCPTIIQISRTPRHWKFTQHRTTRPPPFPSKTIPKI